MLVFALVYVVLNLGCVLGFLAVGRSMEKETKR